ncbi:MAG: hypothetical protein ABJH45_25915, partial [Paracoccaceae bacterium]
MEYLEKLVGALPKLKTRIQLTGFIITAVLGLLIVLYDDGQPGLDVLSLCFLSAFILIFFGYFVELSKQFSGKFKLIFGLSIYLCTLIIFSMLVVFIVQTIANGNAQSIAARLDLEIESLEDDRDLALLRQSFSGLLGGHRRTTETLSLIEVKLSQAREELELARSSPLAYVSDSRRISSLRNEIGEVRFELLRASDNSDAAEVE